MSGDQPPPPPGWGEQPPPPGWDPGPPAGPQPGPRPAWQPYPQQPGWQPDWQPGGQPGWPAGPPYRQQPAHKPGAIPLRPLGLGDLYDGAFRIIRYNPRATMGIAVVVAAVATVLPALLTLLTGSTGSLEPAGPDQTFTHDQVVALVGSVAGLVIGAQLRSIGLLYVTGMVAHVTSAAAEGRKLTIGEAWAATRGKRWRLLGMSFLLGLAEAAAIAVVAGVVVVFALNTDLGTTVLAALVLVPLLVVGYLLFDVRVRVLSVPALMLEPVGVFGAIGRAVHLSAHQFWRLLGLTLLTNVLVAVAGGVLGAPFTITGQLLLTSDAHGLQAYVLLTSLGSVVTSAVLQPFTAAVTTLLYVDQRIRKEAYDVELLSRTGISTP